MGQTVVLTTHILKHFFIDKNAMLGLFYIFFLHLFRVFGIRLGTMMFAFIIIVGQLVFAFGGFLDRLWVMEVSLFLIFFDHIIK